jgi:hypothetical protein
VRTSPTAAPDTGVRVVLLDLGEDVPRQRDELRRAARRLVGDALGVASDELPLRRGRNGKPELDGAPLHFAAAAQGACGAVALCRTDRVGLELAPVRAEPPLDGLAMVLPDRVQRDVKAAAPEARPREFALWWARLRAAVTACAGRLDEAEECMAATPQRARLVGPNLAAGVAGSAVATGPVRWERDR